MGDTIRRADARQSVPKDVPSTAKHVRQTDVMQCEPASRKKQVVKVVVLESSTSTRTASRWFMVLQAQKITPIALFRIVPWETRKTQYFVLSNLWLCKLSLEHETPRQLARDSSVYIFIC